MCTFTSACSRGTDKYAHSLPRPSRPPPTPRHTVPSWSLCTPGWHPWPRGLLSGAAFLPAAAQRADVGGESTGTSINHSQTLLQRLQELLRQGNASDVVLRVQAAGTDEVRVFHTHRLLLGLHSELFRELLSNQSEVVLQEPRDCAAVFDKFIRWARIRGSLPPFPGPWLLRSPGPRSPGFSEDIMCIPQRSIPQGLRFYSSLLPLPFPQIQPDSLPLPASPIGSDASYQVLSELFPNLVLRAFKNCRFPDPGLGHPLQVWGWAQQ